MRLRSFVGLVGVLSLVGCATTRSSMPEDQLQMRLGEMESQLEQKDQEISELKDQVKSLSEEVKKREASPLSKAVLPKEEAPLKKEGVIRVNVSVDQVQLALKNAGYYSGAIDGKLGEKTKQAIAEFQKAHNLNPDGIVGRKTWEQLKTYVE